MGLKEDDEDEGNVEKYLGRTVKKFFKGYGNFIGEVVSFNRARKFFKVKYADGDREELDLSELKGILVDVEKEGVKEPPEPKGAGGRKRKRDQPVKYRKGVVENGPVVVCQESLKVSDVSTSSETLFPDQLRENSQLVENTVGGSLVTTVGGQDSQRESDQPQAHAVNIANGVAHVDHTADKRVDGRGKKRTVENTAPVVESTRPARLKKRARNTSSGSADRERISPEQPGQQPLELKSGASLGTSEEGKDVLEAASDAEGYASVPGIPIPASSGHLVSRAVCIQSSASVSGVTSIATSLPQQLTSNGLGCTASDGPSSGPLGAAEAKGSPVQKPFAEKQVETIAKDVYSLRAIRAISRCLPVQRQMATAGEEVEFTDNEVVEEVEPEFVPLKQPLPLSSTCLGDLDNCIADLFQAYSFLRSFSHTLFLSPFALEEFVVALTSEVVSPMLDCVHVSLLQGLRRHLERLAKNGNNCAIFCLRLSDWSLLDNITWPAYLMAYALTQGFLMGRVWSFQAGLIRKDYYKLPVDKKLAFLNFLCDKVMETDEVSTEITRRIALENDSDLVEPKACTSKRPDRIRRDIISLEGEFDEEFERMTRQKSDSITQRTGIQGLVEGKSLQAGELKQVGRGEDGNLDECVLCSMDGVLICCDGCPAAYHSRCVGITKQGLPPGDWFCPECRADKLDSKGIRIPKSARGGELLFVGPDGQRFFASCGYLLVSEPSLETDSTYRYYSPKDIPKFLKHLEDAGRRYAALQAAVQQLCQPDLDFTPTVNQIVPGVQTSHSVSVEEKDLAVMADSAGDPNLISGTFLSSSLMDPNVHSGVPNSPEPPGGSKVEDKSQKESVASEGDAGPSHVATEESVTPTVDPSIILSEEEGKADIPVGSGATEAGNGGALSQGAQEPSPLPNNGTYGPVLNTATLGGVACPGNDVPACYEWTDQKDEPVDLGKATPMAQHVNGKCFPRQLDGNFSSFIQINAGAYINKYTNGEIVFTAAALLAAMAGNADDAPDDKGGSQKKVKPPSAADQLKAFSQAAPTFFWPSLRKRAMEAPKEKCGWCINCRTPNRKGCLLTQVTGQISGGAAGVPGGIKPIKGAGGQYAAVAAYMLYMEEHLQGLLAGPWEMAGYRKLWRKRVEHGRSIEDVRGALLEMECGIRKVALTQDWEKVIEDGPPLVSKYMISVPKDGGGVGSKKVAPKRRGRPPVVSKAPPLFAYDGACFGVKWWRGGQLSRQVYNWESLPRKTLRKAARQGGLKEIQDLVYTKNSDLPRRTLQCAWRARTEKASAVAQLAVQVRCLDKCIKWSEMMCPFEAHLSGKASNDSKMTRVQIVTKSEEKGVVKYLLHFAKDVAGTNHSSYQQSDHSTKIPISSSGNCGSRKVSSPGTKEEGESEQWSLERDVPLWLVKDFEQKKRKTEQSKQHKSVKGRKGQKSAFQKEPSFWDKLTDPDRYKLQESPSSWICGICRLSCTKSQARQCQRCTENFHISCTEVEESIDGRESVAVCKSCAKLRLGQRNRKPSYKIRSMLPHYDEGSFVGCNKGDADECIPKSSSRRKDKGSSVAGQSSLEKDFCQSGKRKPGNRKNGLLLGPEDDSAQLEVNENKGSYQLQENELVEAGRSKSGRKLKSLQTVGRESHTSPDMIQTERRRSSRIKNSLSPGKCPHPLNQDQSLKVKLKLGKELTHTSAVSVKEDENRSSKRKTALRKDGMPTEADLSEHDLESTHVEKKKSPQKRKRLKVLLQGLPVASEDTDSNHVVLQSNKKKASNGLQYVRRKMKTDEEVARFKEEKLIFAGHVGIDPATGPRCSLCSEGYDPGYSFIGCEWCEEWYHGDAIGLNQEDVPILMGFKCHKCRKCRAPSCPVSGTRQRRSVAKVRRRGGIDHGEVIDAENVNNGQPSWRYPLEKDLIGFNDTKDFVAATNQAEQALAVDGSNFGHGLTGSVFELGSGLMCDLEQQLQLTTPLSSLSEHNVNLWASSSVSGQLDLPSAFSPPLDLSGRGTASLSFTELLASEDDYLEGVAGPGLPLVTSWAGDEAPPGSAVASSAAWCGGGGVAGGVAGPSEWNRCSVVAGSTASAGWSGGESSTRSPDVGASVGWTQTEHLSVSDRVGTIAGWVGGEGCAAMGIGGAWSGRMDNLASVLTPSGPTTLASAAFTTLNLGSVPPSSFVGPQAEPSSDELLRGKDKEV